MEQHSLSLKKTFNGLTRGWTSLLHSSGIMTPKEESFGLAGQSNAKNMAYVIYDSTKYL